MSATSSLPQVFKLSLSNLFIGLFLWWATFPINAQTGKTYELNSPNGRIRVSLHWPSAGTGEFPQWSANFEGKTLLKGSRLGLQISEGGELMRGAKLLRSATRNINQTVRVLFGKTDQASDYFHERAFELESPEHRRLSVVFRCYNDAVAFRYVLSTGPEKSRVVIEEETTSFGLQGNPAAYVQYLENYTTSHEHNVTTTPLEEVHRGELVDTPLTLSWPGGIWAAITEASLRHYAGVSLKRSTNSGVNPGVVELTCQLTPRPDGTKVVGSCPLETPWRVVLIAERPGALLESSTLYCLNEPTAIGDVSWIKPGKITFSWWNGDVYDGHRDLPILSLAMAKKYIDFCARTGIPTHSLTSDEKTVSPWYFQ